MLLRSKRCRYEVHTDALSGLTSFRHDHTPDSFLGRQQLVGKLMLMASDLRMALDPASIGERVGLELDAWQSDLLHDVASGRAKRVIINSARQTGKSETVILCSQHQAYYHPGSLILLVSSSQRQSAELFRRFMINHAKVDGAPKVVAESALRAEFANGSRVLSLPASEKTTRGYAGASMVVVDEASRVPDELFAALRPTMATVDGSLIMLSTPNGQQGEFYRAWTEGGDAWTRVRVPASECPRLSESFLREERAQLGDALYRQEYMLEFLTDTEAVFDVNLFKDAIRRGEQLEAFF